MSGISKPAETKRASNRSHARNRAAERYDWTPTDAELDRIAGMAERGGEDVVPLRPDHVYKHRTWIAVKLDDRWIPAVYDRATRSVVTCLPERVLDRWRGQLDPPKAAPPIRPMPTWNGDPQGVHDIRARRKELVAWIDEQCLILNNSHWTDEIGQRFPSMDAWREWRSGLATRVKDAQDLSGRLRDGLADAMEKEGIDVGDGTDPLVLLSAAVATIETLRGSLGCKRTRAAGRLVYAIRQYLAGESGGEPLVTGCEREGERSESCD